MTADAGDDDCHNQTHGDGHSHVPAATISPLVPESNTPWWGQCGGQERHSSLSVLI